MTSWIQFTPNKIIVPCLRSHYWHLTKWNVRFVEEIIIYSSFYYFITIPVSQKVTNAFFIVFLGHTSWEIFHVSDNKRLELWLIPLGRTGVTDSGPWVSLEVFSSSPKIFHWTEVRALWIVSQSTTLTSGTTLKEYLGSLSTWNTLICLAQSIQSCPLQWKGLVSLLSNLRGCLLSSHSVKTVRDWEG